MLSTNLKVDSGLSAAYRAWAQHPDLSPDAGISIYLTYQGDLAAIEALGFEPHSTSGDRSLGVVRFKDIPKLSAHPNVLWMAAGRPRKHELNTAVPDIKARATALSGGGPADGVWYVDVGAHTLTHIPKGTGKGVIVAILDSGIDVTHPMFLSQLTPGNKKTRILKIWDQGLEPTATDHSPNVALLESAKTYGVEYDSNRIEDHLKKLDDPTKSLATIAHKDCVGHGTHVAGIAAGGTMFPDHGDASRVGVAPEADIIVVKLLDVPDPIFYRKPDGSADTDTVGWTSRFHDAVYWCLRTAAGMDPPKPVVINMSFGDPSFPGDGLDDEARWLDDVMNPALPADKKEHFPNGAIIVKTAGNLGPGPEPDPGKAPTQDRQVARITIPHIFGTPDDQQVIVPLVLTDSRMHMDTTWERCDQRPHKPPVGVHFWYRRADRPLSVRFAMRLPNNDTFGAEVMVGGTLQLGFNPIAGPPPNDIAVLFADTVHRYTLYHEDTPPVSLPGGALVRRQYVHFFVEPKVTGTTAPTVTYHPGQYEMRITAPQDTVIFLVCDTEGWNAEAVFFQVGTTLRSGAPIDPSVITILEEFTSTDPLGRHVITVAAYNDADGHTSDPRNHFIANFSSRGPLRDYSDPAAPIPVIPKPDIAAPGVKIDSASGKDIQPGLVAHGPWWGEGVRFQEFSGTSMAAPMIAGVVALMLEKNPNLNTTQVRQHLSAVPRAAVNPSVPPASTNAYGAGMADALATHQHV